MDFTIASVRGDVDGITATGAASRVSCGVARFDIIASITLLPSGEYLVMVSVAPRHAWSASAELEERRAGTEREADETCLLLIDRAMALLRERGDELGDIVGPRRLTDRE
jgi:hypothetical protein